ncbi:MAG TPA: DUF1761 domain-containing protein [Candidatus Binatia bacterium]|nr:DUF1761 domain-containing protein [Candidatus Binatia bacterium]
MSDVNLWAVLAAAVSAFVLGGAWYSPALFGNVWNREAGITAEMLARAKSPGHGARVFASAFVLALVASVAFARWLDPDADVLDAVQLGFCAGLCFVGTSFGINYLFAQRSWKMFLIDAGYHTAQFTLYGLIIGAWR